ncbi:hypothetical protein [Bacteroides sp. 51]|uniref:hypothetical protein n=1 Tax=Bacteroides sp. 51 TaxID=2302938 RepID=UPI0013D707ED|nr:hypothetical protein [Bacteroides sp. 51]NDV81254.1 hypothetical protein [Bacteroides sp. 51]
MLDTVLKDQLRTLFKDLSQHYTLDAVVSPKHPKRQELEEMLNDLASCSTNIDCRFSDGNGLQFTILQNEKSTRIKFRSTPNGHEFSSLVLAILNCDGKGKNLPSETVIERIKKLNGPIYLTTYVNLSCLACSEIVQALDAITVYSDQINHEIVDGGINKLEVIEKNIMGLPTVFADGDLFLVGRADYLTLIDKLEAKYGTH